MSTEEGNGFNPIEKNIFKSRIVFISGVVNSEMADRVNKELLALEFEDPNLPVVLWINSPGGEVYSGFSIYDTARFIKPKIITVVCGNAASMGSVISLCAEKENRVAFPHSKILIHQPLIGGVIRGQASDIEIHANDIIKLKKKMHELYADRTGTAVSVFEKLMDRDRWVETDEAIELGLISHVIGAREELEKLIQK